MHCIESELTWFEFPDDGTVNMDPLELSVIGKGSEEGWPTVELPNELSMPDGPLWPIFVPCMTTDKLIPLQVNHKVCTTLQDRTELAGWNVKEPHYMDWATFAPSRFAPRQMLQDICPKRTIAPSDLDICPKDDQENLKSTTDFGFSFFRMFKV